MRKPIVIFLLLSAMLLLACCKKKEPEGPYVPWIPDTSRDSIKIGDATLLLMLTEQNKNRILLIDVPSRKIAWEWIPEKHGIPGNRASWFNLPSEVKRAGDNVLVTASGGGVALIRVADRKVLFYANPGGNPHSAELLPDGNVVVASSSGNVLTVYKLDATEPYVAAPSSRISARSAHNVVWDKKRNCLWSAVWAELIRFSYNPETLSLSPVKTYVMDPENTEAHELAPVYGEDALYVTTNQNVYKFDIQAEVFGDLDIFQSKAVKSISHGPGDFRPIMTRPNSSSHWTTEVNDFAGNRIFFNTTYKIYKARWFVDSPFSR